MGEKACWNNQWFALRDGKKILREKGERRWSRGVERERKRDGGWRGSANLLDKGISNGEEESEQMLGRG